MSPEQFAKLTELRQVAESWLANHQQYNIGAQSPQMQEKAAYMQQVLDQCNNLTKEYQRLQAQGGYQLFFVGADNDPASDSVRRAVEEIGKAYNGQLTVAFAPEKEPEKLRAKYKVEAFPTVFFMNGTRPVAKHQGEISQSMLSKKVNMLLTGGDFSDSRKGKTLQGQKTVSNKETVAMGKFLVLFFDAVWCGVSKMMKPQVETAVMNMGNRIHLEKFDVNYRPKIATKFQVKQIPTTIFIHKGKEVGRLEGYFDDEQVSKIVEQFVDNEKAPTLTSTKVNPLEDPNGKKQA